jgi:hypothetical protein
MPRVGLELTTPVFERAKAVHACDRVAIVMYINEELLIINASSNRLQPSDSIISFSVPITAML